ncbi:MAG: hypothetical protein AAGM21_10125 [Pseudomonadota bacterium]
MTKNWPYVALLCLCIVVPVAWFLVALFSSYPIQASQGGAVGVALSFFTFFLRIRGQYNSIDQVDAISEEYLETLKGEVTSSDIARQNSRRIDAIKRDLRRARKRANLQNTIVSISSAFSTIVWGFGDQLAEWITMTYLS